MDDNAFEFNVPQRVLSDTRDGNSYRIRKLADGKCWMTENLKLVGPFKPDKTDSDVTWNRTDTNAFELTASYSGTWCDSVTSWCYNQSLVLDSDNTAYGTYYNWYAATAGTGKFETASGNAPSSICPKGWRLPTGGGSSEFQGLYEHYDSPSLMLNYESGPNFTLAGIRVGNTTGYQGEYGRYWSSTAVNATTDTYYLNIYPWYVSPEYSVLRTRGHTVRCLAK